jgi:hypothetical protein
MKPVFVSRIAILKFGNLKTFVMNRNNTFFQPQQMHICIPISTPFISFQAIHKHFKISMPSQVGQFKLVLLLSKNLQFK